MKTVVIYSGAARSFQDCLASQRWQIFRRLKNPVFFASIIKDAQSDHMERLKAYYPDTKIEYVEQPAELPVPKWSEPRALRIAHPYPPTAEDQGILKQLYGLNRTWEFAKDSIQDGDTVIRLRPDLLFRRFSCPLFPVTDEAYLPVWSRWGGVNDRFGVMGVDAARAYFTTFQRVQELCDLGAPLHPESLIMGALELAGVKIHNTLVADFATLRLNGEMVGPDYHIWDVMDLMGKERPYL